MIFVKFAAKARIASLALVLLTTGATAITGDDPVVSGAYIVEFVDGAAHAVSVINITHNSFSNVDLSNALKPAFYNDLSSNAIDATPRLTLSHELFNGASFVLKGSQDNDTIIEIIHQMDIVSKIWPVRLYNTPATVITTGFGGGLLNTTPKKRAAADSYAPHVMGGVDKLHAEGFTGEGMHVGIVDTGVDYNHPALGGGFGPGHKVIGGYDLVGDDYNGLNTPVPDSDPMDCQGHGTHVSGIIGASENPLGFSGIVPNATLSMWKVYGCTGAAATDVLIDAFNMAYEAGVDVISSSIGGKSGWVEDAWDIAVQRIAEKGTPCVLAGGNDGVNGLFDTSSASESIGAISIGSVDNIDTPELLIRANGSSTVVHKPNTATGGSMSAFTSWGPSFEGWLKPEVSAPGGSILSTFPLALGGYAVLSGTSMATPYISGVAALIQQVKGQRTAPAELAALLASTATPVIWNNDGSSEIFLAPVIQQGGGLVNAYKAAHTKTLVDLDNIALNDTSNFQPAHLLSITNTGSETVTYNFANILAATAYTFTVSDIVIPAKFPPDLTSTVESGATIDFNPSSITIGPQGTGQIVANFTAPQGLNASRIPVYSGYVQINGTNGDTLSVPYGGISSRLKDAKIVDTKHAYPHFSSASSQGSTPFTTFTTFVLPGEAATTEDTVLPAVVFQLAMGSRIVRVDLVPENLDGVPSIIGEQTIGSIANFPAMNNRRGEYTVSTWDGRLADGTWAPEGNYTLLFRALRIFGTVDDDDDYERYQSVLFEIMYQVKP